MGRLFRSHVLLACRGRRLRRPVLQPSGMDVAWEDHTLHKKVQASATPSCSSVFSGRSEATNVLETVLKNTQKLRCEKTNLNKNKEQLASIQFPKGAWWSSSICKAYHNCSHPFAPKSHTRNITSDLEVISIPSKKPTQTISQQSSKFNVSWRKQVPKSPLVSGANLWSAYIALRNDPGFFRMNNRCFEDPILTSKINIFPDAMKAFYQCSNERLWTQNVLLEHMSFHSYKNRSYYASASDNRRQRRL